jgi:hypothetical protein
LKGAYLLPCDVFVTRGPSLLAKGIRWATRDDRERPTQVNHVGAIVEAGPWQSVNCIEALERVEHHGFAEKYFQSGHWAAVYRPLNISDDAQGKILAYLHNQRGRKYGYGKIALHLLRKLTGWDFWLSHQTERYPICSYLVANAWKQAGLDFGCDERLATPDDIHDFMLTNPDKYQFIMQTGRLR